MTKTYFLFLFLLFACTEDDNIINHSSSFHNSKYYQQELTNGTNQKHIPKLNPIDTGSIWEKPIISIGNRAEILIGNIDIIVTEKDGSFDDEQIEIDDILSLHHMTNTSYIFRKVKHWKHSGEIGDTGHVFSMFMLKIDRKTNLCELEYSYEYHNGWWYYNYDFGGGDEKIDISINNLKVSFSNKTVEIMEETLQVQNIQSIDYDYYSESFNIIYGTANITKHKFHSIASTDSAYIDIKIY